MIEELIFFGKISNASLWAEAFLINPVEYGFSDDDFVFAVNIWLVQENANISVDKLRIHIMDKQNCQQKPRKIIQVDTACAGTGHAFSALFCYDFSLYYLCHKVRLIIEHCEYGEIGVIEIKH